MNSNFLIILFLFVVSACGVKAKPLSPPETAVQSYIESYTGPTPKDDKKTDETKKPEQTNPLESKK